MKTLYRLKPRVKLLKDFYVLDTETGTRYPDGSIQWKLHGRPESFQFGVIYGHNYCEVFKDIDEIRQALMHPRFKDKYIFMHNAEYDLNVLYDNIYKFDPNCVFNGKFICASNTSAKFADSTNIFGKIKLAEVGKMLGIRKPDLGDSNLFSVDGVGPAEINRCIKDCEITYEGLISIFTSAGDMKITQASLSMTYFRRFHQPHDIEYNENVNFFYDSYYGGRTEVFKLGPTNSSVEDVNSMYPYWMMKARFPNPKFLKCEISQGWQQSEFIKYFLNQILPTHEGLVYCTVKHKETDYGFLPTKIYKSGTQQRKCNSDKGKLVFPVGIFSGCWNLPEIRFALEKGTIEIVYIERIVYSQGMPSPFETYVKTLYGERLQAEKDNNAFQKYRVKIFMNSLYGKFAQRIDEETTYIDDVYDQWENIREMQVQGRVKKLMLFNSDPAIRKDAMLVLKSSKNITCSYAIPSFASYVTSYGRIMLLEKMLQYHGRKVTYCDTDSVFFENAVGIESEFHLGGWKLEDKIVTQINGLKDYKYVYYDKKKDVWVNDHNLKGVPKSADYIDGECQDIETRDFLPVGVYSYHNLLKTKEALRRNLSPGVLTKRIKKLKGTYDKRIVLSDGETKPIFL